MIRLGDEVRDAANGFEGPVIRVDKLPNGARQIGIRRTFVRDGARVDIIHWIKEQNLVVTKMTECEDTCCEDT